jgi:hypothetical protein
MEHAMRLKTGQTKRLFQYDLPASQVCKDLLEMMGPCKIISGEGSHAEETYLARFGHG